jgi:hypothetical protein
MKTKMLALASVGLLVTAAIGVTSCGPTLPTRCGVVTSNPNGLTNPWRVYTQGSVHCTGDNFGRVTIQVSLDRCDAWIAIDPGRTGCVKYSTVAISAIGGVTQQPGQYSGSAEAYVDYVCNNLNYHKWRAWVHSYAQYGAQHFSSGTPWEDGLCE